MHIFCVHYIFVGQIYVAKALWMTFTILYIYAICLSTVALEERY